MPTRLTTLRSIPRTKLFRPVSLLRKGDSLELFEQRLSSVGCVSDDRVVGKGEEIAMAIGPDGQTGLLRSNRPVPDDWALMAPNREIFFSLIQMPNGVKLVR